MTVLQTVALPLGDEADADWKDRSGCARTRQPAPLSSTSGDRHLERASEVSNWADELPTAMERGRRGFTRIEPKVILLLIRVDPRSMAVLTFTTFSEVGTRAGIFPIPRR